MRCARQSFDESQIMTTTPERILLDVAPAAVLLRAPVMGRVMQVFRHGGATHERIGKMDEAVIDGDYVVCRGACHDARILMTGVASVVADRSGRMKDKALPKLEFRDAAGAVMFSIISLDGMEPFDAALDGLSSGKALEVLARPATERAALADADPGFLPFNAAAASAAPIDIELTGEGFRQNWRGVIEEVKPAMGFINVMCGDFHLHLQGGAVAGWKHDGSGAARVYAALDQAGAPTGLRVYGDLGDLGDREGLAAAGAQAAP